MAVYCETYKKHKTGSVRMTSHWGAFLQPLLQWKSSKYYIFWVHVYSLCYPTCSTYVHIVLSSVASLTVPYFSALFHKLHDFRWVKRYRIWNVCFDILYKFVLKHFSF